MEKKTPSELPERAALTMYLSSAARPNQRMVDDWQSAVRTAARDRAQRVLWDRAAAKGPHTDRIRAPAQRHKEQGHRLARREGTAVPDETG